MRPVEPSARCRREDGRRHGNADDDYDDDYDDDDYDDDDYDDDALALALVRDAIPWSSCTAAFLPVVPASTVQQNNTGFANVPPHTGTIIVTILVSQNYKLQKEPLSSQATSSAATLGCSSTHSCPPHRQIPNVPTSLYAVRACGPSVSDIFLLETTTCAHQSAYPHLAHLNRATVLLIISSDNHRPEAEVVAALFAASIRPSRYRSQGLWTTPESVAMFAIDTTRERIDLI
ncbi:hypothetical protein AC579_8526 [Pseudocercospora musae]|uniref:Uncharacterized protein n=1 Tax=Pseudocercospora musae TaxID=113226 RepID=A0A139I9T9_9PEZI|nr:hypothetical protein AC579_8526 [Pseudocercospora musae]